MKKKKIKQLFDFWEENENDLLLDITEGNKAITDDSDDDSKSRSKRFVNRLLEINTAKSAESFEIRSYERIYAVVGVFVFVVLSALLVFTVSLLPLFGAEDTPHNNIVSDRYTQSGMDETGAVNIVAGMILDYRAFDTLGESHVLFTALLCVFILLKNTKKQTITSENDDRLFNLENDVVLKKVVSVIFPVLLMFGFYIMLEGHLGPGGGFSGGAVIGAGLILYSIAFGKAKIKRFFNEKTFKVITCSALCFYSLSKSYSFFTGANGIESIIPKGIPGNIISSGLILPLNIAVGMVVACTMYGFYSVFKNGEI